MFPLEWWFCWWTPKKGEDPIPLRLFSELVVELEVDVEDELIIRSVGFDLDVWIGDRMRFILISLPL